MTIIERIVNCLGEKKKTMSGLCDFLHISTSTMGTWKKRKTDPPAKYIVAIATFLEVEVEWLLTGKSVQKKEIHREGEFFLYEDEIKLIEELRKCDIKDQGRIMGMVEVYAKKNF